MSKITFRIDEATKEAFKDHCSSAGTSMSEVLEGLVKQQIKHNPNNKLPDDPKLARAYEALYWNNGGYPVDVEVAETVIADRINLNKETVRTRIMTDLQKRGYVTLRTGMACVAYIPNVDLLEADQQTGTLAVV